jgi:hypothetical protein
VSTQSRAVDRAFSPSTWVPPVSVSGSDRYTLFSEEVRTATRRRILYAATYGTCNPLKGSSPQQPSPSNRRTSPSRSRSLSI